MIIKPTSGAGSMGVYKVVDEADLVEKVKQLVSELKGDSDAGNNAWIYQYDAGLKAEAPIVAETYVVRAELSGGFISAGWLEHVVTCACAANKRDGVVDVLARFHLVGGMTAES
jgi:biotin carboxylase